MLEVTKNRHIDYIIIDERNYHEIAIIRHGKQYMNEFKRMLKHNAVGIAAVIDGVIVGYGWAKCGEGEDKFFDIDSNVCLLASFYVRSDYRGNNIYPNLVKELISITKNRWSYSKWYIAIFCNNTSSLNGAKKVGFHVVREYKFDRVLRKTLNKAYIP
ncbi:GNAT family N-acetyltransferase [Virgibacillus natechei]